MVESIHRGIVQSREKIQESLDFFGKAAGELQGALAIYEAIAKGSGEQSIGRETASLSEVVQTMARTSMLLSGFTAEINPYVVSLGTDSLEPLSLPPPVPLGREDYRHYQLHGETDNKTADYQAKVDDIWRRIQEGEDPNAMEELIGKGGYCYVFDCGNGMVVKIPHKLYNYEEENIADDGSGVELSVSEEMTAGYIDALKQAEGLEGVEQLTSTVMVRDQSGDSIVQVPVAEKVPGKTVASMTPHELGEVPQKHYDQIMGVFDVMAKSGLTPDNDSGNMMYDPEKGFTVIDYKTQEYMERTHNHPPANPAEFAQKAIVYGALTHNNNEYTDLPKTPEQVEKVLLAIQQKYGDAAVQEAIRRLEEQQRLRHQFYWSQIFEI